MSGTCVLFSNMHSCVGTSMNCFLCSINWSFPGPVLNIILSPNPRAKPIIQDPWIHKSQTARKENWKQRQAHSSKRETVNLLRSISSDRPTAHRGRQLIYWGPQAATGPQSTEETTASTLSWWEQPKYLFSSLRQWSHLYTMFRLTVNQTLV